MTETDRKWSQHLDDGYIFDISLHIANCAILVEASGSITRNSIGGLNQGTSGCQEGSVIEVRNPPFDGAHPDTVDVEIAYNHLTEWQKAGILCNGDVDCWIHENQINESATQADLAANSIQLGFSAMGIVEQNRVQGNQWLGTTFFARTEFLLFAADTSDVINNVVQRDSDVGMLVLSRDDLLAEMKTTRSSTNAPMRRTPAVTSVYSTMTPSQPTIPTIRSAGSIAHYLAPMRATT